MPHIKYGKLNFIVVGAPLNMERFKQLLIKKQVTNIVKACHYDYNVCRAELSAVCEIHEFVFEDGGNPPSEMTSLWIKFLFDVFYNNTDNTVVLTHCISGLGRSPLLVCIALIVCEGMEPLNAINFIRKHIKYALNTTQLHYIQNTKWSKYITQFKKLHSKGCIIL